LRRCLASGRASSRATHLRAPWTPESVTCDAVRVGILCYTTDSVPKKGLGPGSCGNARRDRCGCVGATERQVDAARRRDAASSSMAARQANRAYIALPTHEKSCAERPESERHPRLRRSQTLNPLRSVSPSPSAHSCPFVRRDPRRLHRCESAHPACSARSL